RLMIALFPIPHLAPTHSHTTTATLPLHDALPIFDDSRTIRRSAETMLSKEGCEVITANDGFAALALIHKHDPDLIFVDIMMPRQIGRAHVLTPVTFRSRMPSSA